MRLTPKRLFVAVDLQSLFEPPSGLVRRILAEARRRAGRGEVPVFALTHRHGEPCFEPAQLPEGALLVYKQDDSAGPAIARELHERGWWLAGADVCGVNRTWCVWETARDLAQRYWLPGDERPQVRVLDDLSADSRGCASVEIARSGYASREWGAR